MTDEQFFAWLRRQDKEASYAKEARYYGDPARHVKFESEKRGKAMKRDLDEAELLLLKWADDMRRESTAGGYPEKASGGFIESWVKDSEDEAEAADAHQLGKINAAIDSLMAPHKRIIYKMHGLSYMVWSFSNEDALYHAAKEQFRKKYFGR